MIICFIIREERLSYYRFVLYCLDVETGQNLQKRKLIK